MLGLLADDEGVVGVPDRGDTASGPELLEPGAGVLGEDLDVRPAVGAYDVLRRDAEEAGVGDVAAAAGSSR